MDKQMPFFLHLGIWPIMEIALNYIVMWCQSLKCQHVKVPHFRRQNCGRQWTSTLPIWMSSSGGPYLHDKSVAGAGGRSLRSGHKGKKWWAVRHWKFDIWFNSKFEWSLAKMSSKVIQGDAIRREGLHVCWNTTVLYCTAMYCTALHYVFQCMIGNCDVGFSLVMIDSHTHPRDHLLFNNLLSSYSVVFRLLLYWTNSSVKLSNLILNTYVCIYFYLDR